MHQTHGSIHMSPFTLHLRSSSSSNYRQCCTSMLLLRSIGCPILSFFNLKWTLSHQVIQFGSTKHGFKSRPVPSDTDKIYRSARRPLPAARCPPPVARHLGGLVRMLVVVAGGHNEILIKSLINNFNKFLAIVRIK